MKTYSVCPFRTAPERSDRRALVEQTSKPLMKFSRAARSFKTGRLRFLVRTGRTPGNLPTPCHSQGIQWPWPSELGAQKYD